VEDWIARGIGLAGVAVALASICLTAFLWRWSGPRIRIEAFMKPETGSVHLSVVSTGRLTVTVRALELRDEFVLKVKGQNYRTEPISRWVIEVEPPGQPVPVKLAPTEYLEADVDVRSIFGRAVDSREVTVTAWVQSGDGRWSSSKPLRLR
jgi:hypothetical protein